MGKKDPRVDEYIRQSADFAKPILNHIREVVHKGCPDIEEQMKWSFPHFVYKGIVCSMASFKEHCALNFWKGDLIFGANKPREAMGQFGRLTSVTDLPSDKKLADYVREAARLNETGAKAPSRSRPRSEKRELTIPDELQKALKKNKNAQAEFEKFTYSHKKEYAEWIAEAKTEETRNKRLANAIEWIAEGKSRNWKYAR